MTCRHCSTENPETNKFCGSCGRLLDTGYQKQPVAEEDGAYFCAKHKKEITRVTCGKCDKPICHRCTLFGPAGVRCRECARNKVPLSIRGIFHDTTRGVAGAVPQRVWYLALFYMVLGFFTGIFRRH